MKTLVTLCLSNSYLLEATAALLESQMHIYILGKFETFDEFLNSPDILSTQVLLIDTGAIHQTSDELLLGVHAASRFRILLLQTPGEKAGTEIVDLVLPFPPQLSTLIESIFELSAAYKPIVQPTNKKMGIPTTMLALTKREFDVASLVAKDFSYAQIAKMIRVREQSVRNIVSVVVRKLDCDSPKEIGKAFQHLIEQEQLLTEK